MHRKGIIDGVFQFLEQFRSFGEQNGKQQTEKEAALCQRVGAATPAAAAAAAAAAANNCHANASVENALSVAGCQGEPFFFGVFFLLFWSLSGRC